MFSADKILDQVIWGNPVGNYVWFAGILFFGLILLRVISRGLSQLLFKLFKRFSQEVRGEKFVELMIKPVEFLVLVSTIYSAINRLDYPLHEAMFSRKTFTVTYIDAIDKIFLFLMIIAFSWVILRLIDFMALVFAYRASLTESKSDDQLVPFIKELVKIITCIISIFVGLGMVFEINVLTLITGLGIGGIAIALAAKESLENLLGSFTIFLDKPFVVGDLVRVNGIEGTVEKVGFRSTQLRTVDKSLVTVPNKKMIDGVLENMTLRNYRRLKFVIGLTYDTTEEQMKNIVREITELVRTAPRCNSDGIAIFEEFGDSSLNIMVLYYMEMMEYNEYLKIREQINFRIAEIVRRNGSDFAFPTQTVVHQYSGNPNEDKETL
jgi:MscS family membrane protein